LAVERVRWCSRQLYRVAWKSANEASAASLKDPERSWFNVVASEWAPSKREGTIASALKSRLGGFTIAEVLDLPVPNAWRRPRR
jgi:hypothetical protein